MATRVLAFMCHPDDIEFTAAGTLARLKNEAGCAIALATATSGDGGTKEYRPDELSRIRHAETVASAKILEAEYYQGGGMDLLVMYDAPTLRRFVEIVRRVRPDIVIAAPPDDYAVDHEHTSKLVRSACFCAGVPNFFTNDENPAPAFDKIPHLYYVDPQGMMDIFGTPVEVGFIVDITDVMPIKEKMLRCHQSQETWLKKHHNINYIEHMKEASAIRGKQIGRPYGEAFRQHVGPPHPQDNLIAELLKKGVVVP